VREGLGLDWPCSYDIPCGKQTAWPFYIWVMASLPDTRSANGANGREHLGALQWFCASGLGQRMQAVYSAVGRRIWLRSDQGSPVTNTAVLDDF